MAFCWLRRLSIGYGPRYLKKLSTYNALSGVVGHYTGKILYIGLKNKYCGHCKRNSNAKLSCRRMCAPKIILSEYGIRNSCPGI